jgi:tetratricopeptide (TPR) repeat protein
MRASAGVALFAVLGYLPFALGQAKDDPCAKLKSDREVQECHAVVQISPKLHSAAQSGITGTVANDPTGIAADLRYDVHMSDCEDRWVALYHSPEDRDYTYVFVYIDPDAGFTLHYFGVFTIDNDHNYHEAPNPIPTDKMSLKIRLEQNGVAALLPPRALKQLGLPEKPDWLKYYEDKADPVTHKVNWGFFYNAIGDSRRALNYLESAYSENPDAPRVVIELAYAYNALGRSEDAIRISKSEFARNPKNELLCREIAFAYLKLQSYKEATEQYQSCIALCDDSDKGMAEKSELAMNLSSAYKEMGDIQNHDAWMKKARDWAPKGSPVYKYFHPDEQ